MTYINNNVLVLKGYALNLGNSKALKESLLKTDTYIDGIHLENNSLTDIMLKEILEGCWRMKTIKSFVYSHNQMGKHSINYVLQMLENMKILRISNWKMSPSIINSILLEIDEHRHPIEQLTLSNICDYHAFESSLL